jgi:hypothetical protein
VPSFDTLTYSKKLQDAGFTARQAEAQAEALRQIVEDNLATKRDLKDLEAALRTDLKEVETKLSRDLKETEAKLSRDLKETEAKLSRDLKETEAKLSRDMELMRRDIVIWLGGIIIAAITTLGVLMKLL